jgi:hypothetical protein
METFAPPRPFVDNPQYGHDRHAALGNLNLEDIDAPIRGIVAGFTGLPHCFTLQSCYGHFVYPAQPQLDNLEPLPAHDVGSVKYRIAYVAFCLENSARGRRLHRALERMPAIDPEYVQFGSPKWFWERHVNTWALQVEPARFAGRDEAIIDYQEALHVQRVRDRFFARLADLVLVFQRELRAR